MGIQFFYLLLCQILSLRQGLDAMGDWDQHARVLGDRKSTRLNSSHPH